MIVSKVRTGLLALFVLFTLGAPFILPVIADDFWVSIYTEILIWSLFASSVNLLFGYVGLLSFGQALFFGFGMYGVAIGITKLGLGFWGAFGLGLLAPTLMAVVAGALAVRLTWHYFAIITVVFSLIFYFLAMTSKPLTGGDDGLVFSMPPIVELADWKISLTDPLTQYMFIVFWFAVAMYLKHRLAQSPMGRALVAVRENDQRARLIGLNVYLLRLTAFVMSGAMAGLAGVLFAMFGRYASASYMFYHVSGEGVVWTIIGGAGTLFGPLVGTALMTLLREELSTIWDHYLILVGVLTIATVIFAPKGVAGLWNDLLDRLVGRLGGQKHADPNVAPKEGTR